MGRKKPTARDEENPLAASQGGEKLKKKPLFIDDDEYSVGTELSEKPPAQEEKFSVTGRKKGEKGNTKASQGKDDDPEVEDEVPEVVFTGKKMGKSKKGGGNSGFSASNFGLLGDGDDDDDKKTEETGEKDEEENEPVVSFTGKKKSSRASKKGHGSLFTASAFDAIDDDNEGEVVDDSVEDSRGDDDDNDKPVIAFTGKKKSLKGGKKGGALFTVSSFGDIDDGEEANKEKNEDEDVAVIAFTSKKTKTSKSSKKTVNSFSAAFAEENLNDDVSCPESARAGDDKIKDEDVFSVAFSSKEKSSKKKSSSSTSKMNNDIEFGNKITGVSDADGDNNEVIKSEETTKKKKKNKKSGQTPKEEEDLDKILAELGEGPPVAKPVEPPAHDGKVEAPSEVIAPADAAGEKEGEEETMESAAAKKKKKKKEKEKEKKAAAAAVRSVPDEEVKSEIMETNKSELKTKAAGKKVPKQVREMQEELARRKEAEERKKREEEEKLRKEEEERCKQEELERQAEEARRKKKEREKEKLQKKKLEGKPLTVKQKEEARRLEAMRKQFFSSTEGVNHSIGDSGASAKWPIYQTKKSKRTHHLQNGAATVETEENEEAKKNQHTNDLDTVEPEKVKEVESIQVEDKVEPSEAIEEDGVEEDDEGDEWDTKSWDDVAVNLSSKSMFADEEEDSEPEPVPKKEIKNAIPNLTAAPKAAAKSTSAANEIENKKQTGVIPDGKNSSHDPELKKDPPKPSEEHLRSPICCIMGHVDAGKTKLLDCIRGTNIQGAEAGGITQQIGATYFTAENIRDRSKELKADAKLKVPGLLVIDTPGHASFNNLRSRGSGLCDIAVLVVDLMHGLQQQTIESLNLLKMRNTEFIVALNKVDRLYGWKVCHNAPIVKALKQQSKDVKNEFNMRLTQIVTQFKEQGVNTELYYKNKDMGETFNIVPTSAHSGEGIPDLLLLLVQWTQKTMVEKLTYSEVVQCTVLDVKAVEGHGHTIDVVLVNGALHEGDQIVVCGMQGPIVTTIRALLTPHPMKELRVKGTYLHHKEIKAAMGIKISAQWLEHAIAGASLYVVRSEDDLEDIKEAAMEDMGSVMSRIDKTGEGVCVQASTLGSLEALLDYLKTEMNTPVSGVSVGPVHKKDVMIEKKKEYATILAFDVKVTPEARELAEELGVKICDDDVIYSLFNQFEAYLKKIKEEKKRETADEAVFPCVLKIIPNCIFNKKNPIVLGVDVLQGIVQVGTPICIPSRDYIDIGHIASIESNNNPVDNAKKGQHVAIKIVGSNSEEQQKIYGRHFGVEDELVSHITRRSIDVLKANYRDSLSHEEWMLVAKLKKVLKIL